MPNKPELLTSLQDYLQACLRLPPDKNSAELTCTNTRTNKHTNDQIISSTPPDEPVSGSSFNDAIPSPHFVVAYSGGVDSTVLLHALVQFKKMHGCKVSAIHVHHGLSQYADSWLEHCQAQCETWGVAFFSAHCQLNLSPQQSVEAAARDARYQAIDEIVHTHCKGAVVLLAQHQDDQLETFILQLKRGAGPKGLSSMAHTFTRTNNTQYCRPVLDASQADIERYANTHKLSWVDDDSNTDTRFDRNFLRHKVLPLLSERWPSFAATAARSASLCAQQQALLDSLLTEKLQQLRLAEDVLCAQGLQQQSKSMRHALIRAWLASHNVVMPSSAQMHEVDKMIAAKVDAQPLLQLGKVSLRRYQSGLYLLGDANLAPRVNVNVDFDSQGKWQHDGLRILHLREALLPSAAVQVLTANTQIKATDIQQQQIAQRKAVQISCAADAPLEITYGAMQRRCRLANNRPSKTLKQWYKEAGIPPWQRANVPVLCTNNEVLAVAMPASRHPNAGSVSKSSISANALNASPSIAEDAKSNLEWHVVCASSPDDTQTSESMTQTNELAHYIISFA